MWAAIALAFGLAMDATVVSAARGLAATHRSPKHRAGPEAADPRSEGSAEEEARGEPTGLRARLPRELVVLPLLFGGFQSGMAALGWVTGLWIGPYIARWDHWVAFGLLTAIGGKMLIDAWGDRDDAGRTTAGSTDSLRSSIALYLGLAVATSIDAAAAGLTLPLLAVAPWLALTLIGAITAACSAAGYAAGGFVGTRFGARLAVLGGLVLIGIGVRILVQGL